MQGQYYDNFMERNSLIPLRQLETTAYKPCGFDFVLMQNQIRSEGLNPDDFYFNPGNSEAPYCYYRASVLLDFDLLNNTIAEIKNLISRLEQDINKSVAKRDFDRFLALVDRRLAPDLFMEVFNFIPDQDKYRLFERVWRFNPNSQEVFSKAFIAKVSKYKGCTSALPVSDAAGYVPVYRSCDAKKPLSEKGLSWTTDINQAICQGLSLYTIPVIYRGQIHKRHILSYDSDKKEIESDQTEQIEALDLINLTEFKAELKETGIIQQYDFYSKKISTGWFHNPQGIHALGHTKRVLFLSLVIAYLEKYCEEDRNILGLASIYHDIGRSNDGYDPDHGIASYDKLISQKLLESIDHQEQEILKFLVQNHAIPDQSAYRKINRYDLSDVERTLRLYDAFKDADGLDRVRIKDLNPEYLRTRAAHRLLLLTHQLYNQEVY